MSQHEELWPVSPTGGGGPVGAPRLCPLPGVHEEAAATQVSAAFTPGPGHMHMLTHGAGFGFQKWRNGTGCIRGALFCSPHGKQRAWTSLGVLLYLPQGVRM